MNFDFETVTEQIKKIPNAVKSSFSKNTNTHGKRKRKRRLRKPIRIFLWCVCILAAAFLLYSITSSLSSSGKGSSVSLANEKASDKTTSSTANLTEEEYWQTEEAYLYPEDGEYIATILLDPGHGDFDVGNVAADGTLEKNLNLVLAKQIIKAFKEINPKIRVLYTHLNDTITWADNEIDDLEGRVNLQNSTNADYFLSVHCNSFDDPSVYGYNFYIRPNDEVMESISELIAQEFEKIDWSANNGIVTTDIYPLYVVAQSEIPSVLIEVGYMSNLEELENLKNEEQLTSIGKAIAEGFNEYITAQQSSSKTSSDTQDTASQKE